VLYVPGRFKAIDEHMIDQGPGPLPSTSAFGPGGNRQRTTHAASSQEALPPEHDRRSWGVEWNWGCSKACFDILEYGIQLTGGGTFASYHVSSVWAREGLSERAARKVM